jgi:hypothetical protein
MAHSPEPPKQYVCNACQTVHAGTVVEHTVEGEYRYEAPEGCGACGGSEFTPLEDWAYRHD